MTPEERGRLMERFRKAWEREIDEWKEELIKNGFSPEEAMNITDNYR